MSLNKNQQNINLHTLWPFLFRLLFLYKDKKLCRKLCSFLAWIVMYTQKIEYKEDKNKTGSGWKEVRARYTKQCGSEIIKEEGTMRIEGTSIY